jgi:hypothetical protein
MALTPDGQAIDTRPSDATPPLAVDATDHDPAQTQRRACRDWIDVTDARRIRKAPPDLGEAAGESTRWQC